MIAFASSDVRAVGGAAAASNAVRSWTDRRGVLVALRDGAHCGLGECSPLAGHSSGSLAEVTAELSALLARPGDLDLRTASSEARFAIETALLDLEAQRQRTSVAALLCGVEPVTVAASALLGDPREGRRPASEYRCVKFKVGPIAAWSEQRAALDAFAAAQPDVALRLDFNGSLETRDARAVLEGIGASSWRVDYVEDPVFSGLRVLDSPVDIAVDAMLITPGGHREAIDLAAAGRAQVVVLKPALLGGLSETFALARSFAAAGLCPVVSHLLDGPTALAGCAELACAIAAATGSERAAGVGPHPALAAYGGRARIPQLSHGLLRARVGGLGVEP